MATKTLTPADLKALTAAELETLQLAVNAEVAIRIQNERLQNRLEVALTDAQTQGFTDAQIDSVFQQARAKVQKGKKDPAANQPTVKPEPGKIARGVSGKAPTKADVAKQKNT